MDISFAPLFITTEELVICREGGNFTPSNKKRKKMSFNCFVYFLIVLLFLTNHYSLACLHYSPSFMEKENTYMFFRNWQQSNLSSGFGVGGELYVVNYKYVVSSFIAREIKFLEVDYNL